MGPLPPGRVDGDVFAVNFMMYGVISTNFAGQHVLPWGPDREVDERSPTLLGTRVSLEESIEEFHCKRAVRTV